MSDDEVIQLDLFGEDQRVASVPLATPEEIEQRLQLARLSPDERVQGMLNIAQLREQLDAGETIPYIPSRACTRCGGTTALLESSGNQLPVRCASCGTVYYNAPKAEVGLAPRTVQTLRDDVSPSQQARILDRDHGRCILCGGREDLVIGHLLSLQDGERLGATQVELYDDANLAALCEGCNSGLSGRSISPITYRILLHLIQASIDRSNKAARTRVTADPSA